MAWLGRVGLCDGREIVGGGALDEMARVGRLGARNSERSIHMPRPSLHLRPTPFVRGKARLRSRDPVLSCSLAMSHRASSSHRYQLHTPPSSPMSALMARSSTPDLLDEWAVVSDDEGNSVRAKAEPAITHRSEQNGSEKGLVTECKLVVPVEYAG